MGQAERTQERPDVEAEAVARRGSGHVPVGWFLDPADPRAGERYRRDTHSALDDQATALLAAHGALTGLPGLCRTDDGTGSVLVLPGTPAPSYGGGASMPAALVGEPVQPDVPLAPGSGDDDGELSWQTDALCAQTDPEAFFPEKGGSTRDAKKVCGSCLVKFECLEYALQKDERFGIWGGMSERERRRLRKRAG